MQVEVTTLEAFNAEAARFASTLSLQSDTATLVTLTGELGAGKTAFTKAVAQALGVTDVVNSPTFVLEKIYEPSKTFTKLIHIDAYRLESGAELAPLKLDEVMKDPNNLVVLEWPERVEGALPPATHAISIAGAHEGPRTITYG